MLHFKGKLLHNYSEITWFLDETLLDARLELDDVLVAVFLTEDDELFFGKIFEHVLACSDAAPSAGPGCAEEDSG